MTISRYNPFDLLLSIMHAPSQSVFKKLKYFLLSLLIYATIVLIVDYKFNFLNKSFELGQFHLLFSFCLAIIISFRINIAYARWWEARGQWGFLINNCRNFGIKFNNYIGFINDADMKNYISKFPILLTYHLRGDINNCKQVINSLGIKDNDEHLPNLLIHCISNKINNYRLQGVISFEQFILLDPHIVSLVDILGSCEKILNTTPPQGFSIFTRFALLFYILIFPFGWINSFEYFIIPIIIVIIYILLGLEVLAEEMELPFETSYNNLPLESYSKTIEINIIQIAKMQSSDFLATSGSSS